MSDIAILLNPSAGRGKASRKKENLENHLKYYGINYDISVSQSEKHLAVLAAEKSKNYETIVGVGGDTTFNIIINELMKQGGKNIFGMVGLGSYNDIVREFGLDSLEKACFAIKSAETREVDLGVLIADGLPELYFLGSASLGLGSTVTKYVENKRRYPILGRLELFNIISGIYNSFSAKEVPIPLKLNYDNTSFTGNFSLVVFSNTSFHAGGIKLHSDATPYDELLNCCCTEADSFLSFLHIYYSASKGKHVQRPDVKLMKSQEFGIQSENGVEIQTDGKVIGIYKNITLSVKPKAMTILVNPNYVGSK